VRSLAFATFKFIGARAAWEVPAAVTGEQRGPTTAGGAQGKVLGVQWPRGPCGKGQLGAPAAAVLGVRRLWGRVWKGAAWEVLRWERGSVGAPVAAAARAAALGRRGTSMRRQR
jgi:hypothetical protein